MAAACVGAAQLPDTIQSFVAGQAEGIPFLVEEVLAGLIGEGALTERDGSWHAADLVTAAVPATFADACGGGLMPWTPIPGTSSAPPRCSAAVSTGRC